MKLEKKLESFAGLLRRLILALLLSTVLCAVSCKSPTKLMRSATQDSTRNVSRYEQTLQPVPMSVARTKFPVSILYKLPDGTGFSARQGQAKVDVKKITGDSLEVTATCDSLAREVIRLSEELTRIRNDTTSVVVTPPERVVREPTGFQWFQIWIGRIALLVVIVIVIKRRYGLGIKSIIKSILT